MRAAPGRAQARAAFYSDPSTGEGGSVRPGRTERTLVRPSVLDGRSTPGEHQENDVDVDIWKLETMPSVDASVLDDY